MKYIFTSATESYLPNARILAKSVKANIDGSHFILLFNDIESEYIDWDNEPFDEVYHVHKIGLHDFYNLSARYSVIEFCTAVKGYFARYILNEYTADTVTYLDPDCEVFGTLDSLFEVHENYDLVLTPHITDLNDNNEGIESHEIAALKHGTFNLGFFSVKNTRNGREFLDWWSDRLIEYSDIDFQKGLFTDQKWCNLAPYLFKGVYALLDRAYNTATWNMNGRFIAKSAKQEWLVNGKPLQFYHFSGFGYDFGWADRELGIFSNGDSTKELWDCYKEKYAENSVHNSDCNWHWGEYSSGISISQEDRIHFKSETTHNRILNFRSDDVLEAVRFK